MKDGLKHGKGNLISKKDSIIYTGQFKNGVKHGKGIQKIGEIVYEGSFENGVFHGLGNLLENKNSKRNVKIGLF